MSEFERRIEFTPAFDRRDEGYGVHGVDMRWYLIGPEGAVQFVVYTNWMLPHVQDKRRASPHAASLFEPLPADIGFHMKKPMYEGQEVFTNTCEFTDNGPCYYDGSSLIAQDVFKILVEQGHEAVWEDLEARYLETIAQSP